MVISANCKREATRDLSDFGSRHGTTKGTACEHCLLLLIEADCTEFFPIADQLIFHDDLMDRQLALVDVSVGMKDKGGER